MMDFTIEEQAENGHIVRVGSKRLDVRATREQLETYRNTRRHIQHVLVDATPDQREFLISGILPAEWDQIFADMDDDEMDEQGRVVPADVACGACGGSGIGNESKPGGVPGGAPACEACDGTGRCE